jgi:hypothetical protein
MGKLWGQVQPSAAALFAPNKKGAVLPLEVFAFILLHHPLASSLIPSFGFAMALAV